MCPNERQQHTDDDLKPLYNIFTAAIESSHPVSYLQTMEIALTGVMEHTTTIDISRKEWLDMTWRIDSMRTLLRDYHRDLERAAHIPGHRCITPCDDRAGISRVPEYFEPCLKELCTAMRDVILLVQKCNDILAQALCSLSLQDEIQQRCRGVHDLLNSLKICLNPKTICSGPLDVLVRFHKPVPIMKRATPRRYRLVDCSEVMFDTICIKEFIHFPHVPYATVSYVWRGSNDPTESRAMEFSVECQEKADPICVDVLRDACKAALARGATHIFIDRLCIMQTDEEDKNWQIREMHDIYRSCVTCIVLPGGLRRLVHIPEDTRWIHRTWTLQEAIAPPSVFVLIAWKLGKGSMRVRDDDDACDVEEITRGESAMMPLSLLLDASAVGHLSFGWKKHFMQIPTRLFGSKPHIKSESSGKPSSQPNRRALLPNIAALKIAMSKDTSADQRQYAIWQSAFMRSSSRPVDMIFSIMGLFGIILDTRAFKDNDRIGATIALAQEILKQGGRANWLGVAPQIVPCKQLSTFPDFPFTLGYSKALVRDKDGKSRGVVALMEPEYPLADALVPMPHGSMDDNGYFTFSAKAIRVIASPGSWVIYLLSLETYTALDGSSWTPFREGMSTRSTVFAVLLGTFSESCVSDVTSTKNSTNARAMLVEEHATGKFHVRSYFRLDGKSVECVKGWTVCNFCIGGPETWKPVHNIISTT